MRSSCVFVSLRRVAQAHLLVKAGSEAGSYLRLIDIVCHSTRGSRVLKKKKKKAGGVGDCRLILRLGFNALGLGFRVWGSGFEI